MSILKTYGNGGGKTKPYYAKDWDDFELRTNLFSDSLALHEAGEKRYNMLKGIFGDPTRSTAGVDLGAYPASTETYLNKGMFYVDAHNTIKSTPDDEKAYFGLGPITKFHDIEETKRVPRSKYWYSPHINPNKLEEWDYRRNYVSDHGDMAGKGFTVKKRQLGEKDMDQFTGNDDGVLRSYKYENRGGYERIPRYKKPTQLVLPPKGEKPKELSKMGMMTMNNIIKEIFFNGTPPGRKASDHQISRFDEGKISRYAPLREDLNRYPHAHADKDHKNTATGINVLGSKFQTLSQMKPKPMEQRALSDVALPAIGGKSPYKMTANTTQKEKDWGTAYVPGRGHVKLTKDQWDELDLLGKLPKEKNKGIIDTYVQK